MINMRWCRRQFQFWNRISQLEVSSHEPSSTEMPAKSHKPDDVLNPPGGPKGGANVEVKVHEMQDRIKSRTKAAKLVCVWQTAKVAFPSHSGTAYFAKVGPEDDTLHMYSLNACAVLLDNLTYICDAEGAPT